MEWKTWTKGNTSVSVRPPIVSLNGFGLHAAENGNDIPLDQFIVDSSGEQACRKFMGNRFTDEILSAARKGAENSWMNGEFSVQIQSAAVCIGQWDIRGGSGTTWSLDDFMKYHRGSVAQEFGDDVLDQLIIEIEKYIPKK